MIVVTLLEPSVTALRGAIQECDEAADAFEVRLDALSEPADPAGIRALTDKPLIATCRRPRDGGTWRGSEDERVRLLASCLEAGFEHADVEHDVRIDAPPARLIRSLHEVDTLPTLEEIQRRIAQLATGGSLAKYAARIQTFDETLDLLVATRAAQRSRTPAAVMGLGEFPRVLSLLTGSRLIYGGGRRNAPYQPSAESLRRTLAHWGNPRSGRDLYLVVGHPIAHSLSPRMHNACFQELGIDAAYGCLEVTGPRDLQRLLRSADGLSLRGLSITAPLKEHAYRLADVHTPQAKVAQSVNTLRVDADGVHGHNTDGLGARAVIDGVLATPPNAPILIVGAGGAARGLLSQLAERTVTVAARRPSARSTLEQDFGVPTLALEAGRPRLEDYDLLINATGVDDPVELGGFRGALFDLRYGPQPTPWERHARLRATPFAGGRQLLAEQGRLAFEFWTGRVPPVRTMQAAMAVMA